MSMGKDPLAAELGRRGGRKGGRARALSLTPEQRREIAQRAAAARWQRGSDDEAEPVSLAHTPMVTARGPMCTAGFVRGTTNFMIDLVENPEGSHKLIDLCTRVVIDWLKAQQRAMGDKAEGLFLLDDIVGFVNEEHYLEFAHPYLKRICDAFPDLPVKLYHNDAEVDACLDHLPDCGFNGAPKENFAFAVELSRITIPYLMLISLASLLGGILNSVEKFWVNAAAPILLNIAMVTALLFFNGDPYETARAQAIAVPVGGLLQLGWLAWACYRAGVSLRRSISPASAR